MTFKAILQALRGGRLKFIDVAICFRLFYKKFARLQLKVPAHTHEKIILGVGCFYLSI